MRAVSIPKYGASDVLEIEEKDRPTPDRDEVLIEVKAAGINYADTLQRMGMYPGGPNPPFTPGMEAAGLIADIGADVDGFSEGDEVMALMDNGGYAEFATADARTVFNIPEGMSFNEAAGFPLQYLTAYAALHTVGELESGERVLIHAAAGGVGSAAVQIAREADAEIYATASTEEKLELAEELGADHLINYEENDFKKYIDEDTDGYGADLVLDGVGGDTFDKSVRSLAHFGRISTYGVASGQIPEVDTATLLVNNQSVRGFHLGNTLQREPERLLDAVPELSGYLEDGKLRVIVGETHPLEDVKEAHDRLSNRKTMGKVVLTT